MIGTIRVLHLEDVQDDAELIRRQLIKANPLIEVKWVQSREEYQQALNDFNPDIVISDHSLPGFNSVEAFKLLKQANLNIPFILATATVSEEFAVMMMKEGIADYLLKDRLQRLPLAVANALEKWQVEREKLDSIERLKQSEARFRALIENNFDAIVMRDKNMHVIYSSPSVKRMLGYSTDEDFDVPYEKMIHPDDLGGVDQAYRKMMTNPQIPFPLTMRIRRKNGTYLWSEGVVTNMLDNENVKGFVSNFRDITERKENELQREKITLDLIERNQNLEQYTFIVSHNLRAPVANILGISHLLEIDGTDEADRKEVLRHLSISTRRLDEVIKDLNLVLQLRQKINDQKENVDLEQLVNDILEHMPDLIRSTMFSIKTNFEQIPSIATVRSYLYSIFYNLITNSIKYRQEGVKSFINITSEEAGDRVRLKFVDNGVGIDLETHGAKLFGMYQRFHLEQAEGKGLGLFMTKTQVEALGGKISVKSHVNIGTKFIIEL